MTLNLKGLKVVWIGFLLSLIGGVVAGIGVPKSSETIAVPTSAGSVIGAIVSIVSVILTIVGLSMAKAISDHYRKARNYQIIQLIIAIVFVVLITALVVARLSNGNGPGAGLVVLSIIMVVILAIFAILFYRHLLQGCEDTANLAGDSGLAEKYRKLWKLFLVGLIIAIAGAIVMFIGLGVSISHVTASAGSAAQASSMLFSGALPGMVIMIIGAVITFVFTILLLIRLAKLCASDGRAIADTAAVKETDV